MSDPYVHLISFWVGCGATSICECDDIFVTPLHGRLPSWKDYSSPQQEELPVKEVKTLIIVEFGWIVQFRDSNEGRISAKAPNFCVFWSSCIESMYDWLCIMNTWLIGWFSQKIKLSLSQKWLSVSTAEMRPFQNTWAWQCKNGFQQIFW